MRTGENPSRYKKEEPRENRAKTAIWTIQGTPTSGRLMHELPPRARSMLWVIDPKQGSSASNGNAPALATPSPTSPASKSLFSPHSRSVGGGYAPFVGLPKPPKNTRRRRRSSAERFQFTFDFARECEYSQRLTLDPNTAHKYLRLSENNRVITDTRTDQHYPDHPDRFDVRSQVLCRESVCGRCYWELEWSGRDYDVSVSVSYKSISRNGSGNECGFGCNDQSWSLNCSSSSYTFRHNNIETVRPVKPISCRTGVIDDDEDDDEDNVYRLGEIDDDVEDGVYRVGVYVDHGAGSLSFYSVSDTMSLIHTEHTTFTQTLYPGFGVSYKSSVKLC
ncbi:tripartite motif-containing protein 16-like [Garra rufa]|uniref:tripartite motif-containing protein 16-like n=1 Tax=Garra rufa TaxID=137080 RepID=UPI003CCEF629